MAIHLLSENSKGQKQFRTANRLPHFTRLWQIEKSPNVLYLELCGQIDGSMISDSR